MSGRRRPEPGPLDALLAPLDAATAPAELHAARAAVELLVAAGYLRREKWDEALAIAREVVAIGEKGGETHA